MTIKELETKCRELHNLQALIDEASADADAIKNEIKSYMGDTEEIRAGEYKVTWKTVKSARIDTSALKKALPEIAEQFTKQTTSRRFILA